MRKARPVSCTEGLPALHFPTRTESSQSLSRARSPGCASRADSCCMAFVSEPATRTVAVHLGCHDSGETCSVALPSGISPQSWVRLCTCRSVVARRRNRFLRLTEPSVE